MFIKGLLADASDYYTEKYGVPIEVRNRKTNSISAEAKPDYVLVVIPTQMGNPLDPQGAYAETNVRSLDNVLAKVVAKYGHMYTPENILQEVNSTGDLKKLMSQWASVLDVPVPKIDVRRGVSKWGSFSMKSGGSGNVMLNEFLKFVPVELAEQVIVHELVHAQEWYELFMLHGDAVGSRLFNKKNHDRDFWDRLDRYMPDHAQRKDELEQLYVSVYTGPVPENG